MLGDNAAATEGTEGGTGAEAPPVETPAAVPAAEPAAEPAPAEAPAGDAPAES